MSANPTLSTHEQLLRDASSCTDSCTRQVASLLANLLEFGNGLRLIPPQEAERLAAPLALARYLLEKQSRASWELTQTIAKLEEQVSTVKLLSLMS